MKTRSRALVVRRDGMGFEVGLTGIRYGVVRSWLIGCGDLAFQFSFEESCPSSPIARPLRALDLVCVLFHTDFICTFESEGILPS